MKRKRKSEEEGEEGTVVNKWKMVDVKAVLCGRHALR